MQQNVFGATTKTKTELVGRRMVTGFLMDRALSAENTLKPLRILTHAFCAINISDFIVQNDDSLLKLKTMHVLRS